MRRPKKDLGHDGAPVARPEPSPATCPSCKRAVQQRYCDVCGYDLIKQTRAEVTPLPRA